MKQYLEFLFLQYKLATGATNVDVDSEEFLHDFSSYISHRKAQAEEYFYFLQYLGFDFNNSHCAEVGKGEHDSLAFISNTTLITEFTDAFKEDFKDRIVKGTVKVNENDALFVHDQLSLVIPPHIINTYIQQNPYFYANISGWENLHNSKKNNVIVGVYGNVFDKDINNKINLIKRFKDNLEENTYKEGYEVHNDSYFYAVGSMRNGTDLLNNLIENEMKNNLPEKENKIKKLSLK
jgi:hypothetical protein